MFTDQKSSATLAKISNLSPHEAKLADAVRDESPDFMLDELRKNRPAVKLHDVYAVRSEDPDLQRRALSAVRTGKATRLVVAVKNEKLRDKHEEIGEAARKLPDKKYSVVYMDPPWDKMAPIDLTEMDMSFVADTALLFICVAHDKTGTAWHVLSKWGFEHVSTIIWDAKWWPGGVEVGRLGDATARDAVDRSARRRARPACGTQASQRDRRQEARSTAAEAARVSSSGGEDDAGSRRREDRPVRGRGLRLGHVGRFKGKALTTLLYCLAVGDAFKLMLPARNGLDTFR